MYILWASKFAATIWENDVAGLLDAIEMNCTFLLTFLVFLCLIGPIRYNYCNNRMRNRSIH